MKNERWLHHPRALRVLLAATAFAAAGILAMSLGRLALAQPSTKRRRLQ